MKSSPTIGALSAALAAAQGEMQNPEKRLINPHFKSHYADITAGIEAVRDPLSKHKISFMQTTRMDGDILVLETILSHAESGEWIASEAPVIRFPARPQETMAAMTYYRRMSLFAICGIAGDMPDDDGNEANKQQTPSPKKEPELTETESAELREQLFASIAAMDTTEALTSLWGDTIAARRTLWSDDANMVRDKFTARKREIEGVE